MKNPEMFRAVLIGIMVGGTVLAITSLFARDWQGVMNGISYAGLAWLVRYVDGQADYWFKQYMEAINDRDN